MTGVSYQLLERWCSIYPNICRLNIEYVKNRSYEYLKLYLADRISGGYANIFSEDYLKDGFNILCEIGKSEDVCANRLLEKMYGRKINFGLASEHGEIVKFPKNESMLKFILDVNGV